MQSGGWLRPSRSEHHLPVVDVQNARINSLLDEMRPRRLPSLSVAIDGDDDAMSTRLQTAPPKYDEVFSVASALAGSRRAPPDYDQLSNLRPHATPSSTWRIATATSEPRRSSQQNASWARHPRPLAVGGAATWDTRRVATIQRGPLSPAGYFRDLEQKNANMSHSNWVVPVVAIKQNGRATSQLELDYGVDGNASDGDCVGVSRNTPRQASFIAAIARHPLRETSQWNSSMSPAVVAATSPFKSPVRRDEPREENVAPDSANSTPMRRPRSPTPFKRRRQLRSQLPPSTPSDERRPRPFFYQEEIFGRTDEPNEYSPILRHRNDATTLKMRRPRPKSYVLATSTSMQEDGEHPSFSQDEASREMSSMGSLSSVEHTSRSLNAPHPPSTHRLHRFIALFNHHKPSEATSGVAKPRMKRSRTSLPTSRTSFPPTILQRDLIERQSWVKHQELALGKTGKRRQWDDRWAMLVERSLYLCDQPPPFTNDKVVELGAHLRVDVQSSIVDIAYDWLSSTQAKQKHVVRIVTQTRYEHLLELATESEMLSWIAVLQCSSEGLTTCNGGAESPCSLEKSAPEESAVAATTSTTAMATSMGGAASARSIRGQLHNSYSIASLTSSCSTAASERNGGLPTSRSAHNCNIASAACCNASSSSATNQLIMHRYKAKNSQLQSPVSNKRMESATSNCTATATQAGTSRETSENGAHMEATTPKSTRKWKKSKAIKQGSGGSSSSSSQHGNSSQGLASTSAAGGVATPSAVLGVRLADCAVAKPGEHVPLLVQICVAVVETHGMDTIGIYRIPGNTAAVNALKDSLSTPSFESVSPDNVEFIDARWRDVNVVSSLLKMFLRKLPEPLLTDKLYPFFIDANRIASHQNRLHKLRNLLRKLPRHHYETLRFLIAHLWEITKHCDVNKMESRNLALMFGPSIVRPSDDNMATMVTHMSDQCKIIETLIHYFEWMFDDASTMEDAVPEQHPSETGTNATEAGSYGVGVPTGVSAASFNDMHNLILKANEDQAAAMMNEGKAGKIKNILRRNSRRDKSRSKLKIESTAAAAVRPREYVYPTPANNTAGPASRVEAAFCGNYQERDIDAEIESRQALSSPPGASEELSTGLDQSPSLESSLGSLPDSSRNDGCGGGGDDEARKKRQQDMHSARRIFIAGSAEAATASDTAAIDALANHSQHLNIAGSPAFEVLSEETREKIRRMQRKQQWNHDSSRDIRTSEFLKTYSPTKDMTDALSFTSDYSTTSSAPLSSNNPQLAVACADPPTSSDYASSDPSPCTRNTSASPRPRPAALTLCSERLAAATAPVSKSQKIRLRAKAGNRDPARRHTLSDVDTLKEGRLDKLARWFGLRKSSPDVNAEEQDAVVRHRRSVALDSPPSPLPPTSPMPTMKTTTTSAHPPVIVRTSPTELTPISGDELL